MSDLRVGNQYYQLPAPEIYPQRPDLPERWSDRAERLLEGLPRLLGPNIRKARIARAIGLINQYSAAAEVMTDEALRFEAARIRHSLRENAFAAESVARSFALIRETARRTINLRHYDVQLMAGLALLDGTVAEMNTGEGKTLAATLAVGTAALAGIPVHVITVNDYLAQRDAEMMGPIYRQLGLSVGVVIHGMSFQDRRHAYGCDVTYATNKEVAFDYLRDRIIIGGMTQNLRLKIESLYESGARRDRLVMRGLHFAIVDEADSVLIDEARTPLIISRETDPGDEAKLAEVAMQLAMPLETQRDYRVQTDVRQIELTEQGKQRLAELGSRMGGIWRSPVRREEVARQSLSALHLFNRDEHYLVLDGRIQIVDEYTGRIMADRSWNEGLHQLIEIKENCKITGRKVPIARISYQRFFRRYRRLAGMTGTAREVASELWSVYRLPVVRIPPNRKLRRERLPDRIYFTQDAKWRAIAQSAKDMANIGRPVLIGTRSVLTSERLSRHLSEAQVEHVMLNAKQDHDEASIIEQAGVAARVTVATNMAGRGVDIQIGPLVAERGGLHVILSERHDAGRIDRQLGGRCGRQGEPGTFEALLSLEDPILEFGGRSLARWLVKLPIPVCRVSGKWLLRRAQRRAERMHSRMRRDLLRLDQKMGTLLAFTGEIE